MVGVEVGEGRGNNLFKPREKYNQYVLRCWELRGKNLTGQENQANRKNAEVRGFFWGGGGRTMGEKHTSDPDNCLRSREYFQPQETGLTMSLKLQKTHSESGRGSCRGWAGGRKQDPPIMREVSRSGPKPTRPERPAPYKSKGSLYGEGGGLRGPTREREASKRMQRQLFSARKSSPGRASLTRAS